jgi:hypothetical protein
MFKFFVFLALCAFIAALFFTLTEKTTVIFQTSCGAYFYKDPQPDSTPAPGFKYTPTIGRFYNAKDLAKEITEQAASEDFPLTVTFQEGRFHISSPLVLRITDTEYSTSDQMIDGVYVGARYGEAARFLNHLMIECEISYPPPDDSGQVYTKLLSTRKLINALIGNNPIPPAPTAVSNSLNANNLFLNLVWTEPPNKAYKVGIYLQNFSVEPSHVENWDLVSDQGVTSLAIPNLTTGETYLGGASFIGRYDESPPRMAVGPGITIPIPGLELDIFNFLGSGVLNTQQRTIIPNTHVKILDMNSVNWPENLTAASQIKSINVKFYSSIVNFLGGQTDARITFGQDGPVIYYGYWRFVQRFAPPDDTSSQSTFPFAFASTLNTPRGTTGPTDLLPYDTFTITDPAILAYIFSTSFSPSGSSPQDVYMWCGYPGSVLSINNGTAVIERFDIFYT